MASLESRKGIDWSPCDEDWIRREEASADKAAIGRQKRALEARRYENLDRATLEKELHSAQLIYEMALNKLQDAENRNSYRLLAHKAEKEAHQSARQAYSKESRRSSFLEAELRALKQQYEQLTDIYIQSPITRTAPSCDGSGGAQTQGQTQEHGQGQRKEQERGQTGASLRDPISSADASQYP